MFVEGLGWGLPSEDLPGACVDRCFDRSELLGVPARQVGALGEVLAQEAVGVLVGAALPGAMRVAEVDRDAGGDLLTRALAWFVWQLVEVRFPIVFPLWNPVIALAGTVVLALLVLYLPVRRAVRFHPGDALRYG